MPDGSTFPAQRGKRPVAADQTTASARPLIYATPGFSIELLGRQLATIEHASYRIDANGAARGDDYQARRAKAAEDALVDQVEALRELILASRPETTADATVQVMVASYYVGYMLEFDVPKERVEHLQKLVQRALHTSAAALAKCAGLPMAEIGGVVYADYWSDPWPNVSIVGEALGDLYDACDGSAFQEPGR